MAIIIAFIAALCFVIGIGVLLKAFTNTARVLAMGLIGVSILLTVWLVIGLCTPYKYSSRYYQVYNVADKQAAVVDGKLINVTAVTGSIADPGTQQLEVTKPSSNWVAGIYWLVTDNKVKYRIVDKELK